MKFREFIIFVSVSSLSLECCHGHHACKSCPAGWTQWGENCYRFYNQPRLSFDDAEDFCTSIRLEGSCPCLTAQLASVESKDENIFLFEYWKSVREPTPEAQHVRIGYTDSFAEGTWRWIDGSSATFEAWDNGQPDDSGGRQDCAVMWKLPVPVGGSSASDSGKWDDQTCSSLRAFFCKFKLY